MSGGHFAGILTPLTCRGSKGRSPLASLGTAQRLAPVQSGLPLCETCLSSPHHWTDTHQAIFSTLRYLIKMEMTVVLWCRNSLFHSDGKYRTIMCRIRHSIFLLCLAYTTFSICKCLSAIFRCYFCFSFSESLSISAEKHKNSSHEHFTDFYQ